MSSALQFTGKQAGEVSIEVAPTWANRSNWGSLQETQQKLPSGGGCIYVPPGAWDESIPFVADRMVKLRGDGATPYGNATQGCRVTFKLANNNTDFLVFGTHKADWSSIEGISFAGTGAAGTGRGLVLNDIYDFSARYCNFELFPSYAFETGNGTDVVNCDFDHVVFADSKSNGTVRLGGNSAKAFYVKFYKCAFNPSLGIGTDIIVGFDTLLEDCTWQSAADLNFLNIATSLGVGGAMDSIEVRGGWMECLDGAVTPTNWMITVTGPSMNTKVRGVRAIRPTQVAGVGPTRLRFFKSFAGAGPTGNYGLAIADCEGDLGPNNHGAGADDIVTSAQDVSTYLRNNRYRDGAGYGTLMTRTLGVAGLEDF